MIYTEDQITLLNSLTVESGDETEWATVLTAMDDQVAWDVTQSALVIKVLYANWDAISSPARDQLLAYAKLLVGSFNPVPAQKAIGSITVGAGTDLAAAVGSITVINNSLLTEGVAAVVAVGSAQINNNSLIAPGDTVLADGHTLVAGTHFAIGVNATATTTNIYNALVALADSNITIESNTATSFAVKAAVGGVAGNSITWGVSSAGITVNDGTGGHLVNGSDATPGTTVTVDDTDFVCGVDFSIGVDEAESASNINSVVDALSNVDSTVDGDTISIVASAAGLAGNDITLGITGDGISVSGSTLSGGADDDFALSPGDEITVGETTVIADTDFTIVGNPTTCATNIWTAILALTMEVELAEQDAGELIVRSLTTGTEGNFIALSTTSNGITLSGETLTGGTVASAGYEGAIHVGNDGIWGYINGNWHVCLYS